MGDSEVPTLKVCETKFDKKQVKLGFQPKGVVEVLPFQRLP